MVSIDLILQEYFDLMRFSAPLCFVQKARLTKQNTFTRGWISVRGIEFNIFSHSKTDVLFYIKYLRPYFLLDAYPRTFFNFNFYIDNFVYGNLYAAVAAYLLSLEIELPLFFGFYFITWNDEKIKYPKRYVRGFRYVNKDLILVGELILKEWLKKKRKEKPSFMSEMW